MVLDWKQQQMEKKLLFDEFTKAARVNFLKSALKVVGTLGLDKNAKLEFAAAKFAMNNENANKIKKYSKALSTTLKTSTQSIKKA